MKTGTGSGKSTVLPPYMIGMGYKKVIVTQPRRLPCREIYFRICSTFDEDLVGYSYSGEKRTAWNPLHYTTDGLLVEYLNFKPERAKDIDVIMLDEIHERSQNVDLILVLIKELRKHNPNLKVILCSATVNDNLINIVENNNKKPVFEVKIARHPVKEFQIEN